MPLQKHVNLVGFHWITIELLNAYDRGSKHSFIYQGTSTRRQRRNLFGLKIKLPPVTTSLSVTTQRYKRQSR